MLMQRVEELIPAAPMALIAQEDTASSLFSQSSPVLSQTADYKYWTTISASPPLTHQGSFEKFSTHMQQKTYSQQGSFEKRSTHFPQTTHSSQSHGQKEDSFLTPALLLEELVIGEEEHSTSEKYLKPQKHQLNQPLHILQQVADSYVLPMKERKLSTTSDDNNNDETINRDSFLDEHPFPSKSFHEELRKLIQHQSDKSLSSVKNRPRTYSIESLLERKDSLSDLRKWTDDDPMWNENLYIEVDEVKKDKDSSENTASGYNSDEAKGFASTSSNASAEGQELSEDICSLFPFPLSITSPLLKSGDVQTSNTAYAMSCANTSITSCITTNGTSSTTINSVTCVNSDIYRLYSCSNTFATHTSPADVTEPTSQSQMESTAVLKPFGPQQDLFTTSFPDLMFTDEEFDEVEGEEVENESAMVLINGNEDNEDDNSTKYSCFSMDNMIGDLMSTNLSLGVTASTEDVVNSSVQPFSNEFLVIDNESGLENQADSENKQQQKQRQQSQLQQRQQRHSFSRRQRQQQQLRQQQKQRKRRRSWTIVKPKIYRHSSLKSSKSLNCGVLPIIQQKQCRQSIDQSQQSQLKPQWQRQKERFLPADRIGYDEEEPVVSTSSMLLDHQGLCKPVEGESLEKNKMLARGSHSKRSLQSRTEKNRTTEIKSIQRSATDLAAANKAREHLNIVERQRRFVLAQAMDKLRDELPYQCEDEQRKLSKLEILRGAKEYINRLCQQEATLEDEKAKLKQKQKILMKRLDSFTKTARNNN